MSFLLKDEAYDKLLKMINDGKMVQGEVYSLNVLAAELEMSRTPVRDAIQKLCDENRIDMLPSRGFRLHQMNENEVMQHYHFSNAIEGYCVYTLAKRCREGDKPDSVVRMEMLVEKMSGCLSKDVPFGEYFRYDKMFHQEILESLGDENFSGFQHSTMGFYDHPEMQLTEKAISRQEIYDCHVRILENILKGDTLGAYEAMIYHAKVFIESYQVQSE